MLDVLNEKQRQAATSTQGAYLVVAGAGSGKTSVITKRIAYLIDQQFINPEHILAITFTNKAANEMRERIISEIGPVGMNVWASTFHSLCVRILRRESRHLGYHEQFSIMDDTDQQNVIKLILKEFNIDTKEFGPKKFIHRISEFKNKGISADCVKDYVETDFDEQVEKVYVRYAERLKKSSSLDFDDLILKTLELFQEFPQVLERYAHQFEYIHVDEFQDTNIPQYELVRLLTSVHHNLCAVGDVDQAIYSWRGANVENIDLLSRDFQNLQTILLEQNYRSTPEILRAANDIIDNNAHRIPKKLWTGNTSGAPVRIYRGEDERGESRYIAGRIEEAVNQGMDYTDIAILYRSNAQSRSIEEMLRYNNIPYTIFGGVRFYDRAEIKDILAYLRLLVNAADESAFHRIVNVPKRGIGPKAIENVEALMRKNGGTLLDAAVEHGGKLAAFSERISYFRAYALDHTITELVEEIVKSVQYEAYLRSSYDDAENRIENMNELTSVTKEYDEKGLDIATFLSDLSLDVGEEEVKHGVRMMTIHAAKGLEYRMVFVSGMEENLFPTSRSMSVMSQLEEERRLAYVALTRAKEILYLTHASHRLLFGRVMYNPISRFITEIEEGHAEFENPYKVAPVPDGIVEQNKKLNSHYDTFFKSQSKGEVQQKEKGISIKTRKQVVVHNVPVIEAKKLQAEVGTRVRHKKYGEGIVVSYETDDNITIDFDGVHKHFIPNPQFIEVIGDREDLE